jgi:hypothetical protein
MELNQCLKGVVYQEILQMRTDGNYGVLYDMSVNGVETNWQRSLDEAYKSKRISKEIYDVYS